MRVTVLAMLFMAGGSSAYAQVQANSGPDMLERVLPAVVSVGVTEPEIMGLERAFGFGDERTPASQRAMQAYQRGLNLTNLAGGSGSGFVVQRGNMKYVVTNAHVIGHATEGSVWVFSITGKAYAMRVIGADTYRDVAVLGFVDPPGSEFSTVTIHTADDLRVGTPVYAIGNPLGYLPYTVTAGVIGAMNRSVRTPGKPSAGGFLQTDAAILPGNSGGPLFGPAGEVVGINTAVGSYRGQQGAQLNYAVEGRHLARFVNDIIEHGRVQRGYLGVVLMEPASNYVVLDKVTIGAVLNSASPLAQYQDARVVSINGNPIRRLGDAFMQLEEQLPGQDVQFTLETASGKRNVTVRTETLTPERLAEMGSWVLNSVFGVRAQEAVVDESAVLRVTSNGAVANAASWRLGSNDEFQKLSTAKVPMTGDFIVIGGQFLNDTQKLYLGGSLKDVGVIARLLSMDQRLSIGFLSGEEFYVTTAATRPLTIF